MAREDEAPDGVVDDDEEAEEEAANDDDDADDDDDEEEEEAAAAAATAAAARSDELKQPAMPDDGVELPLALVLTALVALVLLTLSDERGLVR